MRQHFNQPEPTESQVTWSVSPAHTHAGMHACTSALLALYPLACPEGPRAKEGLHEHISLVSTCISTNGVLRQRDSLKEDIIIASCEQKNLIYWRTHRSNEQWYNVLTLKVFDSYKTDEDLCTRNATYHCSLLLCMWVLSNQVRMCTVAWPFWPSL